MQEKVLSAVFQQNLLFPGQHTLLFFVGLDRLKPLNLDAEEPDYPEPKEFHAYRTHLQSVTRRHDPLHIPQKRAEKASVQTGQNIVTCRGCSSQRN